MEDVVTLCFSDAEVRRVFLPSLILLIATFILSFGLSLTKVTRKETGLKWIHFLAVGTFFSALVIFIPKCMEDKDFLGFVDAVIRTAKMFTFEHTASENQAFLFGENAELEGCARNYLSVITVFTPAVTVTAVLSLFKDTMAQLRYGLLFPIKAHVFSELNDRSICLAKDIRNHERFSQIVFTGVEKDFFEKDSDGLLSQAEDLRAIITRKTILDFHCFMHLRPNIYMIDNEELNNVKSGIDIYNRHIKKTCKIHVFSTLESAEIFIDSVDKNGKAKIDLVNYSHIVAYDLLINHPMYAAAEKCGSKTMSVVVVGAGTVGMECAKAAMWCGRMDNFDFKIRIIDAEDKESFFISRYGDFKEELKKAGLSVDCKFLKADVNGAEFEDKLNECLDANYIVVSTGNDERTINTASAIRKHFIRTAVKNGNYCEEKEPTIIPIITQKANHEAMLNIQKRSDVYKSLCLFGSFSDVYCLKTIEKWPIECIAKEVNRIYSNINNAPKSGLHTISQTKIRSNHATAVHAVYKLKDAGVDLHKCSPDDSEIAEKYAKMGKAELKPEYLRNYLGMIIDGENRTRFEKLSELEHNRWSVFHLLDGWKSWSIDEIRKTLNKTDKSEKEHRLYQALLHGCIVPYDELKKVGKELYNDSNKFIKNDMDINKNLLPKIPQIFTQLLKTSCDKAEIKLFVPQEAIEKMEKYVPKPIDTSDVELSKELLDLVEDLAENTHEVWATGRIEEGWVYGEERNDDKKETPCLKPYSQLPENEKEFDRNTAMETIRLIIKMGYKIK